MQTILIAATFSGFIFFFIFAFFCYLFKKKLERKKQCRQRVRHKKHEKKCSSSGKKVSPCLTSIRTCNRTGPPLINNKLLKYNQNKKKTETDNPIIIICPDSETIFAKKANR